MLILFEGVDNSGKTTIANKISERVNIPIFDANFNKIKEYGDLPYLQEYSAVSAGMFILTAKLDNQLDIDLIQDRSYLTEYIYSKLNINGERERRKGLLNVWLDELNPDNVLFIFISADTDVLKERLKNDDNDDIKPDEIENVQLLYEEFFDYIDNRFEVLRINNSVDFNICSKAFEANLCMIEAKIEIMLEKED
jgi:thymidylate kinase